MGHTKEFKLRQQLFDFMSTVDDEDMPDGAWEAVLEDAVNQFNEMEGTEFGPNTMFLEYVEWKTNKIK